MQRKCAIAHFQTVKMAGEMEVTAFGCNGLGKVENVSRAISSCGKGCADQNAIAANPVVAAISQQAIVVSTAVQGIVAIVAVEGIVPLIAK